MTTMSFQLDLKVKLLQWVLDLPIKLARFSESSLYLAIPRRKIPEISQKWFGEDVATSQVKNQE